MASLDSITRKQVSAEQMEALLEFLQQHPKLARGRCKPQSARLWTQCAHKLNALGDGPKKKGQNWGKYWSDWKYRVRRRALELKAARNRDSKGLPTEDLTPLTHIEECILSLIGENAVEGVIIKNDPLGEEDPEEEELDSNDNTEEYYAPKRKGKLTKVLPATTPKSTQVRKRRQESTASDDRISPPDRKPRLENNGDASVDSDEEDEGALFLRLEKEKLESTERLTDAVLAVKDEVSRMTDVLEQIKDILVHKFNT